MGLVATLRDEIKTRLATISGLNTYDVWPEQVHAPAAIVRPSAGRYEQVMGATDQAIVTFEVHVLVTLAGGLGNAQDLLDPYISNTGVSSLRVAIAGDRTLNGAALGTHVIGWRDYDSKNVNGVEFLGAVVDVAVHVT